MKLVLRLVLTLAAALPAAADETDRLSRTLPLQPGAAVTLQVTNGQVQVSGWDRSDVSVEVVRRAPDAVRLARMPARIETIAGAVSLRVVQVEDGRDAALRSDVVMRVPHAAHLREVSIGEGGLELEGLDGSLTAHVAHGDVVGRNISGTIRVETGRGAIRLERATLADGGLIRLRTFNGDVALGLSQQPANARVLALSMGGVITSDVPLTRKERWGPRWAEATLGTGEPLISIDVVNGNITLAVAR